MSAAIAKESNSELTPIEDKTATTSINDPSSILRPEHTKMKKMMKKAMKTKESYEERRRRSSSVEQQTLRYRIPIRSAGHQQSHTVKNLIPETAKEDRPSNRFDSVSRILVKNSIISFNRSVDQ